MKLVFYRFISILLLNILVIYPGKAQSGNDYYIPDLIQGASCYGSLLTAAHYTVLLPSSSDPITSIDWWSTNGYASIQHVPLHADQVEVGWYGWSGGTLNVRINYSLSYSQMSTRSVSSSLNIYGPQASLWYPAIKTLTGRTSYSWNEVPDMLIETGAPYMSPPPCTNLSWQWQKSDNATGGFTDIQGATAGSYSFTQPLQSTTYFRRKITDQALNVAYSTILKIDVVSTNWEDKNYVREHTILIPNITDWKVIDQLPIGQKLQTTNYLDGRGRTIQNVSKETATPPNANSSVWGDNVQDYYYNEFGRQPMHYLPYSSWSEQGKFKNFSTTASYIYYLTNYNESNAAVITTFYDDPLDRPKNINKPGDLWDQNHNSGIQYITDLNSIADNVHILTVGTSYGAIPSDLGVYAPKSLIKNTEINESGKPVTNYIDKSGQLILTTTRLVDDATSVVTEIATYNIYDDYGRLRYQLQPEAVKYFEANAWAFTSTTGLKVLDELCFHYEYDEKGRTTLKKAPGAKDLRMLYDIRNRVVFMQDGNQAAKSPPEWRVNLYDEYDRTTVKLLYQTSKPIADLQGDIDNSITQSTIDIFNPARSIVTHLIVPLRDTYISKYEAKQDIIFESGFETPVNDNGFTTEIDPNRTISGQTVTTTTYNNPITLADLNNPAVCTVIKYLFYDDYTFPGIKPFDNNFDNTAAYSTGSSNALPIIPTNRTIGYLTGSMTRILGTNQFLVNSNYYDDKGRHIQSTEDNIKSGYDVTTNQFSWDGKLLSTNIKHTTANTGYNSFSILNKYFFDKIGRVIDLQKKIGGNSFKDVAAYDFDDMGRLKTKHLAPGYTGSGKNELESLEYSYNIQNHITGINKDYALKTPGRYDKWGNFFGLYIGYDNKDNVFNTGILDGHVTGLLWSTQGDDVQRKYDYSYDGFGRLANAVFKERKTLSDLWDNSKMNFSTTGRNGQVEYDLNGNIKYMLQKGVMIGQAPLNIDDLDYHYKSYSNQLVKVGDQGTLANSNGTLGDFKGTANIVDYIYDDNGNLITDLNKDVKDIGNINGAKGINYNFFDKPEEINIAGKGTIKIVYDGDGNKLQKIYTTDGGTVSTTTTYIQDFIYVNDNLQYINFEEGRIRVIQPVSQNNGFDGLAIDGNEVLPGGKKGTYDYYIRDYQANVRMILTEETHYNNMMCTMETNRLPVEESMFGQSGAGNEVAATQTPVSSIPGQPYNNGWQNPNIGSYVSLLSKSTKTIGPNALLKVMAGDILNATTQYYYKAPVTNSTVSSPLVNDVLSSLVSVILGSTPAGSVVHNSTQGVQAQLSSYPPFRSLVAPDDGSAVGSNPKAYLTILFFDERFNFIGDGSTSERAKTSDAGNSNASLTLPTNILAPKNGYAYIYLSNESIDQVYFDNFQVSHTRGRIIEENHYYAFGLKIAAISSHKFAAGQYEGYVQNKNLYNDKELVDEADLNWYDYGFRSYDPQVGRFPQLDPLTWDYPYYTPYQYAGNEPIANVDLDGLEQEFVMDGGSLANVTVTTTVSHAAALASIKAYTSMTFRAITTYGTLMRDYKNARGQVYQLPASLKTPGNMNWEGEDWTSTSTSQDVYTSYERIDNAFVFNTPQPKTLFETFADASNAYHAANDFRPIGHKSGNITIEGNGRGEIRQRASSSSLGNKDYVSSLAVDIATFGGVKIAAAGLFGRAGMTGDQIALKELVEETTLGGRIALNPADTKFVRELANEVKYPGFRASANDISGNHWLGPHIHLPGVGSGHIPIIP